MEDCIFCQISQGKIKSWKVFENDHVFAFFDWSPANAYHTLVVPKKHYKDIFDIPENELNEVMAVVKKLACLYEEKLGIENVQIVNSSGVQAQQEVFHIHFHIVPRHTDDGQNIHWTPRVELREEFDALLNKLA